MKYMILLYGSQQDYDAMTGKPGTKAAWTDQELAGLGEFMMSFNQQLSESGELVDTRGLTAPAHARRIQLREGVPVVTDGPYPETQEVLAGYWIVECENTERATEIATRLTTIPDPRGVHQDAVVDVRSIADSQSEIDF